MGGIVSSSFFYLFGRKPIGLLMVGLNDAGKTTILYNLQRGEVVAAAPTLNFNAETIRYKNISFNVWDVSGYSFIAPFNSKVRGMWKSFYNLTDGLIFVVDSSDPSISVARDELLSMLEDEKLKEVPLLVFANKQDLPEAMTTAELTQELKLDEIHNRQWTIQAATATRGDGLHEGLDWLLEKLTKR